MGWDRDHCYVPYRKRLRIKHCYFGRYAKLEYVMGLFGNCLEYCENIVTIFYSDVMFVTDWLF